MDKTKETAVLVKSVCGACGEVSLVEEKGMAPLPGSAPAQWMHPDGAGFIKKRRDAKKKRIKKIAGLNSARAAHIPADVHLEASKDGEEGVEVKEDVEVEVEDFDADVYYKCLATGVLHDDGAEKCSSCDGDCASKELPSILEIEGYAEELFDAKIHESGYSSVHDEFIVVLEKDGLFSEALFKGANGQLLGWQVIDPTAGKSDPITMEAAAEVATKSVEGVAGNVEAGQVEGLDVWTVQVDGPNGEDYDVFVSLDGEVLGYDEYEVAMKSDEEEDDKTEDVTEAKSDVESETEKPEEPLEEQTEVEDDEDEAAGDEEVEEEAEEKKSVDAEFMIALAEFQTIELG